MTNPVILLGTQSNGETLPVQVDATGRLVAEGLQGQQGIQGEKGDPGPPGPPIDLPPDPQEGQVLGWKNGELAWVDGAVNLPMQFDFLLVAGGGELWRGGGGHAGGGAGGVINSVIGEATGGGGFGEGPRLFEKNADYTISVGAKQENTSIQGPSINEIAIAGGDAPGNAGGSGAGGIPHRVGYKEADIYIDPEGNEITVRGSGGESLGGQGFPGGEGTDYEGAKCLEPNFTCFAEQCRDRVKCGGGGGAGGPGAIFTGGNGIISSITGTPTYYGAGGQGNDCCDQSTGPYPLGRGSRGSGGGYNDETQPGILILRAKEGMTIKEISGDLEINTYTNDGYQIFEFNSGSGVVQFS